ncbi:MAG: hypothetical protein ACYC5K_04880 [Saccharofermentanales bacterium]
MESSIVKRINLFHMVNIFLPLVAGALIYAFLRERTLFMDFAPGNGIIGFAGIHRIIFQVPDNLFLTFVKYYLVDGLWSYSFVFAMQLFSPLQSGAYLLFTCILAGIMAISYELLQLARIVSGTYDPWDIAICLLAIFIAYKIIKKKDGLKNEG